MEINEVAHGFRLRKKTEIKDWQSDLYEFEHIKTKAKLCWFARADKNKTFSVAFKTTPENDTGVFHILEHSVLNGSKKYPVKEPFVELLKGSLQTFLNAMTYPDKTLYPVSSRNQKDFMNLVSVYMDAVFHPAIYENPNIFYQEGWHYEIRKAEDDPIYKGVVFNEMKGVFSSVDAVLLNELNRHIFPDNCYRFVSGGDPEKITDLSYEAFIATHQKYYHPSNAYFFLDGAIDIDQVLAFINDEYLCHYDFLNVNFDIPYQQIVSSKHVSVPYEISADEDEKDKAYVAIGKIVSRYDDVKQSIAWNILSQVLVGSNESPFQKEIIESGLGQSVDVMLYDGIQQPWAILAVNNTNEDKIEEAVCCVKRIAHKLVEGGLDHEEIYATLNQMEFNYREPSVPAGLQFINAALASWIYGGEPALYLGISHIYDELRQAVETGYFEVLLKEFLLDEEHLVQVNVIPDKNCAKERMEREKQKLARAKSSWNDVNDYIQKNEQIDVWQAKKDSKAELATLPSLCISDIDEATPIIEAKKIDINGAEVLIYPSESSGIVYLNLYFSLAGLKREDLSAVSFYAGLFKQLPTKNFTVQKLQSEIKRYLGGLSVNTMAYRNHESNLSCTTVLAVKCKVLQTNLVHAVRLIEEILKTTEFDREMVRALLHQEVQAVRQAMILSGSTIAGYRTNAHFSADGVANEYFMGYSYREYINSLLEDVHLDRFINEVKLFQSLLFARTRLTMSITGEENLQEVQSLIQTFPFTDAVRAKVRYPFLTDKKEGMIIPSQVSYSTSAVNLSLIEEKYSGKFAVLSNILTFSYLWNEVRVKGGAYGTGFRVDQNGTISCMSYRDPSPMRSLAIYQDCGKFIRSFLQDMDNITLFIIGSISATDPLLSIGAKIALQDALHFIGITNKEIQAKRNEILSTSKEDLLTMADMLNDILPKSVSCIVGPKEIFEKSDFKIYNPK